jgi:hypothetical protein
MPMPDKDIENIQEFFPEGSPEMTPEEKWDAIFYGWLNKIGQKNLNLNLFELKLWLESLEAFFTSSYLEKMLFRYIVPNQRNYEFYLSTFNQIAGRIIAHLKALDFKKDKYSLNFEEFIVESILESYMVKGCLHAGILVLQPENIFAEYRYPVVGNKKSGYGSPEKLCFPEKIVSQGIDQQSDHYFPVEKAVYSQNG